MSNLSSHRALLGFALNLMPPRLRGSLLDDKTFLSQWEVPTITEVAVGKEGPSLRRDQFYGGIRAAIRDPGSQIPITDSEQVVWKIEARAETNGLSFVLEGAGKHFSIPDHSGLAEDATHRVEWFKKAASVVNLESAAFRKWLDRMWGEPLSDDEFAELTDELEMTPVGIYRSLQTGLTLGGVDIATLVPHERRYYERLIGSLGSATSVTGFVVDEVARLMERRREWDAVQGLRFSLLSCSVGTVSETIRIDRFKTEQLIQIYDWLAEKGDPISQIGAVEVAFPVLDVVPELEPLVEKMIEGFIADNPDDDGGCFSLLSAMIVLVASELTRRRTLGTVPPFYRRQAAITHASLVIRALIDARIDRARFVAWAKTRGVGYIFYLQGLVDLRSEPRWLPDSVSAEQLRAEFIGRVAIAAETHEAKIQSQSLRRLLIGMDSGLARAFEWPFPMLPGPMEGAMVPTRPIPDNTLKAVTTALEAERLERNSFAVLVNTALLYGLPASQAELAATALRRVKYSVENMGDENSMFGLIGALANVAAVTRGTDLADTLRVLVRVVRRRKRWHADPVDELRIAMIAAASHESIEDWARFAGEWITEIAFEVVEKEAAQRLLPKLRRLVQIEPALACHCTAADAALSSFSR